MACLDWATGMNQVFFDGLGNVTVLGNTVRLDFVTFSPNEKDTGGRPQAVFCQRVVMSIESFMRTTEKLQETAQALSKLVQAPREPMSPEAIKPAHPHVEPAAMPAQADQPGASLNPRLFP